MASNAVQSSSDQTSNQRRTISTFSCDTAYSSRPTASRASALSMYHSTRIVCLRLGAELISKCVRLVSIPVPYPIVPLVDGTASGCEHWMELDGWIEVRDQGLYV